jgi:hypothetical protein
MSFLFDAFHSNNFSDLQEAREKYKQYLRKIKLQIPQNVYDFAAAEWHYDPADHRCPHDSWVQFLRLEERASGERSEKRELNIHLQLLGAYHDCQITLSYSDVVSYSMVKPNEMGKSQGSNKGHEDWLIDEIRLSETGLVVHEILFSSGSRWLFECKNMTYECKPQSTPHKI